MSENWQSKPVKASHQMRRFIIYVALLVLAFLAGLVPMWLSSRECSSSLADAERQSIQVRMENSLASAAIDAQRGDYGRPLSDDNGLRFRAHPRFPISIRAWAASAVFPSPGCR
jgi:hypothetical protein